MCVRICFNKTALPFIFQAVKYLPENTHVAKPWEKSRMHTLKIGLSLLPYEASPEADVLKKRRVSVLTLQSPCNTV